ncbi:MAG: AMP-binding protein [Bdellovibrionales bacterium]
MEKPWLKHYPKNVNHEINSDEVTTINDLFKKSVSKFKENAAYESFDVEMSFGELDKLSNDFASFLTYSLKLKKGDRLAIQLPNIMQYPVALFGAIKAGVIVVNTNPLYTEREMEHQFNDSGAKAIVILSNFAHKLDKIIQNTPIENVVVTSVGDMLGFPKSVLINSVLKYVKKQVPAYNLPDAYTFHGALNRGETRQLKTVSIDPEDTAFLQYTGGTTGVSKGAELTHKNIVSNMLQITEWISPVLKAGQETILTPLPLYHIFSLTVNCLGFLAFGGKNILIANPRDIKGFIKLMKKKPFTLMTGVNTLYNALLNHSDFKSVDFSDLKLSVAGGMALQQDVATRWEAQTKTPLIEAYGLTETSPGASANPIDGTGYIGTIGIPLPSTEIKLVDDDGNTAKDGERGEIYIKGPQVMKGYWNNPEETSSMLTSDGWVRTGDIAIITEHGYFKIIDRKKDMILVSGFNVFPNEIEDVIASHPGVLEVAAIGVPSEGSGECVKICVVKKDKNLTKEDLKAFAKKKLTGYKTPDIIEFFDELPKTNVGKILRRALKEEHLKKLTK